MVNQHAERRGSAIGRLTRKRLFCGQIRKLSALHNLERAERYALNESSSGAGGETPSCRKPLHGQSCFTSRAPSRFNGGPGRVPVRLTDNHERRWTGTEAAPALSAFSSGRFPERCDLNPGALIFPDIIITITTIIVVVRCERADSVGQPSTGIHGIYDRIPRVKIIRHSDSDVRGAFLWEIGSVPKDLSAGLWLTTTCCSRMCTSCVR
ncbi:hypothetical protein F2P79_022525 [Pimephales promelas]|nr:hypothetical protein F2P79_022525 [Pimephales promelas]